MRRMKMTGLLLTVFILMAGGLTGCSGGKTPPEQETPSEEENAPVPAPDFTVYDIEGTEVHLSDFIGKPIVLNFWASWCGPCTSEMPEFQAAYEEQGEDIHFLMVNVTGGRETVEKASKFMEEEGYTFPVFYDTDLNATEIYGAHSLPTTFFIDAEGNAIAYALGALSEERLQQGLDTIT